jgi:hypothetical protein
MGEGNVDIDGWIRKYRAMQPGVAVTLENIVSPEPRIFRVFERDTFKDFGKMPAVELAGFLALAEKGRPVEAAGRFGVDVTLQIEQLKLSPAERARRMHSLAVAAESVRGKAAKGKHGL